MAAPTKRFPITRQYFIGFLKANLNQRFTPGDAYQCPVARAMQSKPGYEVTSFHGRTWLMCGAHWMAPEWAFDVAKMVDTSGLKRITGQRVLAMKSKA